LLPGRCCLLLAARCSLLAAALPPPYVRSGAGSASGAARSAAKGRPQGMMAPNGGCQLAGGWLAGSRCQAAAAFCFSTLVELSLYN